MDVTSTLKTSWVKLRVLFHVLISSLHWNIAVDNADSFIATMINKTILKYYDILWCI